MKKIFFPFLICYFLSLVSFAQQSKVDSLHNLIQILKDDTSKINALNNLGRELINIGDYNKAINITEQAIKLGEQLNFKKAIANSYNNFGIAYTLTGNYPDALKNHLVALKTREEIGDKKGIAGSYGNIGSIYNLQENYEEALKNQIQCLNIAEEIGDKKLMANTYNSIGGIYGKQDNNTEAIKNFTAALKIYQTEKNQRGVAFSFHNLGVIYMRQKDYKEALKNFWEALKIKEEIGDRQGMASSYFNIGELHLVENNLAETIVWYNKGLELSKIIGSKKDIKNNYGGLATAYRKMNNYKKAYQYYKLFAEIKDSLFNEESSKQIAEMQTKYDTEKKEQQIKLLNKDKEIQTKDLQRQKTIRNAVAGGLLLVLLFSFVLINRFLLIRKQKKVIEIEREKSEKLLLNILPKDTADELKRNNAVTPKRYNAVTVMFTDFKGFTTIAEKMSAEELVSELDFIFKKFDEIISKYPIEKIKTIGDAYMCAGGLPVANTTNPMDVVLAALEIQEFMGKLAIGNMQLANEDKETPKLQTANWKLRIGIHTGSVIAGVVGDKKFAYDIWGDAVNTASRMESSGEAGKVNISGTTYELIKDKFECIYRGEIEAKNKGKIKMYFVEKKNS